MPKRQFRKSVESLRYQIDQHYKKIDKETAKETPDLNLINYWHKEISGLKKSLARAEKRLQRGH